MICKICGKEFDTPRFMSPYDDICGNDCFGENFWQEIIAEKDKHIIIDHTSFFIEDEDNISSVRGYDGRKFKIKMFDSGKEIITTNLWCQGDIPEKYWNQLPDNAKFIKTK